jgi:hypothetical protein
VYLVAVGHACVRTWWPRTGADGLFLFGATAAAPDWHPDPALLGLPWPVRRGERVWHAACVLCLPAASWLVLRIYSPRDESDLQVLHCSELRQMGGGGRRKGCPHQVRGSPVQQQQHHSRSGTAAAAVGLSPALPYTLVLPLLPLLLQVLCLRSGAQASV